MKSLSFDPVAHIYDQTRGYPPEISEMIARGLEKVAKATLETRFLEVGIGTGRIALPLASLGHNYIGVDISENMLTQLQKKLRADGWSEEQDQWGRQPEEHPACMPQRVARYRSQARNASMRLITADMTDLPILSQTIDVVVAVHIFHLVHNWQQALREILRVLKPGGFFLHCWDAYVQSDRITIDTRWKEIVRELGGSPDSPVATYSIGMAEEWLRQQGRLSQEIHVVKWNSEVIPQQVIENVENRVWSGTWGVPNDIFQESVKRLWEWGKVYYKEGLEVPHIQTRQFVISRTQM